MADVFLSYLTEQRALTRALAQELEADGISVWWDTSLLPVDNFRDEIDRQLDQAKAVIIIWTSQSIKSRWVRAEADHADRNGKLVNTHTPDLDPRNIPKPFNQFTSVQVEDCEVILAALEKLGVRRRRLSAWRRIAIIVIALALAGVVFYFVTSVSPPITHPSTAVPAFPATAVTDYVDGCLFVPVPSSTRTRRMVILYDNSEVSRAARTTAAEKAKQEGWAYYFYPPVELSGLRARLADARDIDHANAAVVCSQPRDQMLQILQSMQLG
jgi:hypothetical protein